MLRIRMRDRETVIERDVPKRDVKQVCAETMAHFGREMVPSGRKDHRGKDIYITREVPADIWVFEWVETDPTTGVETVEPVTFG